MCAPSLRQLPRAYEALVHDRVKFRVGRIVFLAFSRDEQIMGFGFPREERAALVAAEPDKFLMPGPSDLRYQWLQVRMAAIDQAEMEELVLDAWRMCVPRRVAAATWSQHDQQIANHARSLTGSTSTSGCRMTWPRREWLPRSRPAGIWSPTSTRGVVGPG